MAAARRPRRSSTVRPTTQPHIPLAVFQERVADEGRFGHLRSLFQFMAQHCTGRPDWARPRLALSQLLHAKRT